MENLVGRTFGRLTVQAQFKDGRYLVCSCICICGRQSVIHTYHLTTGKVRSCGCLRNELSRKRALDGVPRKNMDGHSNLPEYSVWHSMKQRCLNTNSRFYRYYGGRGITVCDRWLVFANFLSDMGARPTAKHTLERSDNAKGYGPDNCRWATRKEQQNNRRANVVIEFNGERRNITQWAHSLGVPVSTIWMRLQRGFRIDQVLSKDKAVR